MRLPDHPQIHPDPCLSRRLGRRQVSWLADRRLALPSRRHDAASGLTGRDYPLTVAGAAADLAGARAAAAPHSLFTLSRGTIGRASDRFRRAGLSIWPPGLRLVRRCPSEPKLTLVLGGARSGKSRYAESLIAALPPPWAYVATAEARRRGDGRAHRRPSRAARPAMADHRGAARSRRRARSVPDEAGAGRLPDAVAVEPACWRTRISTPRSAVSKTRSATAAAPVVLVANEVGSGIVPDHPLGRRFRDLQGLLNQRIAARAERVVLVVAGLAACGEGNVVR